jgi:phosphoglycolate phosphatase
VCGRQAATRDAEGRILGWGYGKIARNSWQNDASATFDLPGVRCVRLRTRAPDQVQERLLSHPAERAMSRARMQRSGLWHSERVALIPGVVVWDVDGTLIPADLRWLRRGIARTYGVPEAEVVFPDNRVHGYTDESIVVDTAVASGVEPNVAEQGLGRYADVLAQIMQDSRDELVREQPPYPGAAKSIAALHEAGFVQTVLTGNLRFSAEFKLHVTGLDDHIDFSIGGYGSDARDRFELPGVVAARFAEHYGQPLIGHRTVVIGDAANDIACARHGGFRVAAVTHRLSREELATLAPDVILDGLDPEAVVATVRALTA